MKFHHIGYANSDHDGAERWVQSQFNIVKKTAPVFDSEQNAKLSMLETQCGLRIEVISGEVVSGLIKKGINIYHTCFEVESINDEIERFTKSGCILVSSPKPARLFDGKLICFILTPYLGLIELLEK